MNKIYLSKNMICLFWILSTIVIYPFSIYGLLALSGKLGEKHEKRFNSLLNNIYLNNFMIKISRISFLRYKNVKPLHLNLINFLINIFLFLIRAILALGLSLIITSIFLGFVILNAISFSYC